MFYLFLPPFQGSCSFYHPERLYIDSHYDTTHVFVLYLLEYHLYLFSIEDSIST